MRGFAANLAGDAQRRIARRSPLWFAAFATIFARTLRRDFHAVRVARAGPSPDRQTPRLVIYMNHPSWWDAALIVVLIDRLFAGRHGFAPIDETMSRRYGFMPRIGAFGVAQNSFRGAAVFLETATRILQTPDNLLFVTAQGRFSDVRVRPVRLAPGLAHLASRVPAATFVPMAVEYPFWDERKPELLLRFGHPIAASTLAPLDKQARHDALADPLACVMDDLAADATARDASRFTTLLTGSAGVGGVYDAWRRTRAAVRGERFAASHGEQA